VSRDYTNPIFDSGTDNTSLTAIRIPTGILENEKVYYWRVRYQDNHGDWSDWSVESHFTTIAGGEETGEGDGWSVLIWVLVGVMAALVAFFTASVIRRKWLERRNDRDLLE
jgi:hypothetical protein